MTEEGVWCSHDVEDWVGEIRTCSRPAQRIIQGRPFCWQHAERVARPYMHWDLEERDLAQIRTAAPNPQYRQSWFGRLLYRLGLHVWADEHLKSSGHHTCSYCDRKAITSRMAVSPATLRRVMHPLCSSRKCAQKLQSWEGSGKARRARAQMDWEQEHGIQTPYDLTKGIPAQYPSLSRATLRAFLDSGLAAATVEGGGERTVAALNGSIRSLGFGDQVYAEVRSGEAVLRRLEAKPEGLRVAT